MNDSAGILVDNVNHTLSAGADPRTTALALAWQETPGRNPQRAVRWGQRNQSCAALSYSLFSQRT
jgi:hypothetical protein